MTARSSGSPAQRSRDAAAAPRSRGRRSALVAEVVDLPAQIDIFLAAGAAALLDFLKLVQRARQVTLLQVCLAEIFAGEREVGIGPQRFLIVAEPDVDAALLAVRIAEIVEHARVAAVGDGGQHHDRLAVASGLGECPAAFVDRFEVQLAVLRRHTLLLGLVPYLAAGAVLRR